MLLRLTDVTCRYGGDEFLIILPDTPALGAQQVAESLRREIATLTVIAGDRALPVTISLGVAVASGADRDHNGVVERADAALYQAKRGGRDRCITSPGATLSWVPSEAAAVAQ